MMRVAVVCCVLGMLLTLTGCPAGALKGDPEIEGGTIAAMRGRPEATPKDRGKRRPRLPRKVMAARRKVESLNLNAEVKKKLNEKYQSDLAKYK